MNIDNIRLQQKIDELTYGRKNLSVLEAGCGSVSHIRIPSSGEITGIDVSPEQLGRNGHIHNRIVGDVQHHVFGPDSFDVIVCWDVLEHLMFPEKALLNFFGALRDKGLIILAAPNSHSLKGLVTRLTPLFVHVLFYRLAVGDREAGKDNGGPFKTFFRRGMYPENIRTMAGCHGLSVRMFHIYEGPVSRYLRSNNLFFDICLRSLSGFIKGLTMNRFDPLLSDYMIVLQKDNFCRNGQDVT